MTNESWNVQAVLADDWEVIEEPKRVADYFCPVFGLDLIDPPYNRETHEVGKQPAGAVLVPGSERELSDPFTLTPEEKANLPEEDGQ